MTKKRERKQKAKREEVEVVAEEAQGIKLEPMFNTIDFNSCEPHYVAPLSVGGLYFMLADALGEDGLPQS